MPVNLPPETELLRSMKADLDAIDFEQLTGVGGLTIRHARNRPPPGEARNSLSIVWNGTSDIPDAPYKNDWERQKTLDCDLVFDFDLPTEDSQQDVTGWERILMVKSVAINALRAIGSQTEQRTDWVQEGDTTPDHDASGADNARLVQGVTVLYRVLTTDPSTLLWQGEDGG